MRAITSLPRLEADECLGDVLRRRPQLRIAPIDLVLDDQEEQDGERQRERERELARDGERGGGLNDKSDVADRPRHDAAEDVERAERGLGWEPTGRGQDRRRAEAGIGAAAARSSRRRSRAGSGRSAVVRPHPAAPSGDPWFGSPPSAFGAAPGPRWTSVRDHRGGVGVGVDRARGPA